MSVLIRRAHFASCTSPPFGVNLLLPKGPHFQRRRFATDYSDSHYARQHHLHGPSSLDPDRTVATARDGVSRSHRFRFPQRRQCLSARRRRGRLRSALDLRATRRSGPGGRRLAEPADRPGGSGPVGLFAGAGIRGRLFRLHLRRRAAGAGDVSQTAPSHAAPGDDGPRLPAAARAYLGRNARDDQSRSARADDPRHPLANDRPTRSPHRLAAGPARARRPGLSTIHIRLDDRSQGGDGFAPQPAPQPRR